MSQVIQTNGDYKIKTALAGNLILDTGPGIGRVVVTGNLVVEGNTTDVEVADLKIEDNVITLNAGETGDGVTLGYSGIEVDRGIRDKASIVFDESTNTWLFAKGQNGTYSFDDNSSVKLRNITFTDPATEFGNDVTITSSGTGVLKITGVSDYEDRVLADDDIPNKRYVDRRIIERPTFQIVREDSRVTVQDLSDPDDPLLLESRVVIVVDTNEIMSVYNNRVDIQQLTFYTNTIENEGTNENIRLKTNGTGRVEFDYAAQYNHVTGIPAVASDATLVYGATPSPEGGSGVYFVNSQVNGELISKRKALTFSIIF